MAFGDVKGTLVGGANSIPATLSATGSVVIVVGDLIVGVVCEQTSLTTSACADNLGNGYSAQNAGTLSGAAVSGRLYYSRATVAGTLTSVNATCTSSTHDGSMCAAVFTGPFNATLLDTNPANLTNDVTTPYTSPTGTVVQGNALLVSWMATNGGNTYSATSPNLAAAVQNQSANAQAVLGAQVAAAPGAVSPAWTGTAATANVLGTVAFKGAIKSTITVTQTQAVTVVRARRLPRTVTMTSAQTTTLRKAVGKLLLLVDDPILDDASDPILDNTGNQITAEGQAQNVTLVRAVGKRLIVSIAQLVTIIATKVPAGGTVNPRTVTFTQAQSVSLLKTVGKLLNFTQSQLVTLLKSVAKTLTFVQAQVVTLTRLITYLRTISITQAQSVTLTRAVSHLSTILVTQSQLVTLTRRVGKLLTLTQAQVVTLTVQKSLLRTLTVTQAQLVTLTRSTGKLLTLAQAEIVTLTKAVGKQIIFAQAALVTLTKSSRKLISFTQSQLVTLLVQRSFLRTLTVTQAQLVTLRKSVGKLISFTDAQLVTLVRASIKQISVVQAQAVTLIKSVGHAITLTSSQLVTLVVVRGAVTVQKTINLTQAQIVTLTRITGKVITVMQDQVATLSKITTRFISFTTSQVITLLAIGSGTTFTKTITFTQDQLLSLVTTYFPASAAQLIHNLPFLTTPGKIRSF